MHNDSLLKIYHSLDESKALKDEPLVLTIGNFDGVHLGHQQILSRLVQSAREIGGKSSVITFSNHPLEIINPNKTLCYLCTSMHKFKLFEKASIDYLFNIPFTREFSEQDPRTFLRKISESLTVKKIVLGHDARIGKDRQGDRESVLKISQEMPFDVEYLDPYTIDETIVSSSLVRKVVNEGAFDQAKKLLGREYSILTKVIRGEQKGTLMGFPTANLEISKLCLPPYGVYSVIAYYDNTSRAGIANLGFSPTIKQSERPALEVHIPNETTDLYDKEIEIVFKEFIRPEIHFETEEELKIQIKRDILALNNLK